MGRGLLGLKVGWEEVFVILIKGLSSVFIESV